MKKDLRVIKLPTKETLSKEDVREIKKLLNNAANITEEHEFTKCMVFCLNDTDESILLEYNVDIKDKMHMSSILITDAVSENILKSIVGTIDDDEN